MRKMPPILLTLLSCLLAALGVARAGEDALSEKARILLDYQSFMRGDRDGAVRFSISASRDMIGTPLAELAVRIALMYDPAGLSAIGVGEVEARRILSAESELSLEHRDLLRRFVARSFAAAGRREDAMAVHQRRGLAMSWLKAGPFPGRAGLENKPLPPVNTVETDDVIDNPPDAETFRQWRKNPPWRRIPANRSFPYTRPWSGVGSDVDGAMILFSSFDIDSADNNSFFHVYSETSWRLYVDGALLSEVDRNAREAPLEHMVAHALAPGRHTVLLQLLPPPLGTDAANVRVALRLESAGAFTWDCDAAQPEQVKTVSTRREPRPLRFIAELRKTADASPILMAAYALACVEQGMADIGSWWADKAAKARTSDAVLAYVAGQAASLNRLLPPTRRADIAKDWHLKALAAKPDFVPSLVYLARAAMENGDEREAAGYLERAAAVNPAGIDIVLARGEWARRFASAAAVRAIMDEGAKTFAHSPAVQIAAASQPREGFLDMERRLAACRAALEAGPYVAETSLELAEALADSGNVGEAEYVLKNAQELFAGDVGVLRRIAEVYARIGRHNEASAAVADALRITPDNADLWRRLGDFYMETGNEELAMKYWRASLAGRPGQFVLRDMVHYLEGVTASRLYNEGGYDAIAITAAADTSGFVGDVVRLLDRTVLDFAADGSYRRLTHEVDMALTRRGGESLTGIDDRGELLTARIVFPNGNTLEPEPYPGRDGLRLPVIMPGAAREIRVLESVPAERGAPTVKPWFFQDPSGRMQLVRSEYVVRTPKGFPLIHAVRNLGGEVEFEQTSDGDVDVYRWFTDNQTVPSREPDAVHVSERVPSVEVGVRATWDEVVDNELRQLDGRLVPSMRMRSLLSGLYRPAADGRPNPLQAAKAIYRFVCDNIDPTPAGDAAAHIHMDRMGDRSVLLLSLLRAAGLDAHPASARPALSVMHPPTWELPNRDFFTVPMVRLAIPGGDTYWLDTRFDSLPFGKIADDLSAAVVLTFLPTGPLFETLPTLPAEDSSAYKEKTISLPAGEGEPVEISGRTLWRGVAGLKRDRELADADAESRRNLLLSAVYPVFPDAVLRLFEVQRNDDSEAASLERFEISARSPVSDRGDGVRAVSLCLLPLRVISDETRNLITRTTTCHIKSDHMAEDRNIFRLPQGGRFVRLPSPAHIPSSYGIYQLRVSPRGDDAVEIIRNFTIPAQRIEPWNWAGFLKFLERVDLAEKQWIEYAIGEE